MLHYPVLIFPRMARKRHTTNEILLFSFSGQDKWYASQFQCARGENVGKIRYLQKTRFLHGTAVWESSSLSDNSGFSVPLTAVVREEQRETTGNKTSKENKLFPDPRASKKYLLRDQQWHAILETASLFLIQTGVNCHGLKREKTGSPYQSTQDSGSCEMSDAMFVTLSNGAEGENMSLRNAKGRSQRCECVYFSWEKNRPEVSTLHGEKRFKPINKWKEQPQTKAKEALPALVSCQMNEHLDCFDFSADKK